MPLTPNEQERVARWNATLPAAVHLELHLTTDSADEALRTFGEAIARKAPGVVLRIVSAADGALPGFPIGPNLRFHAVPQGLELEPFLNALAAAAGSPPAVEAVQPRAVLELFIAPQCPFCPAALRRLLPPVSADPALHLAVIDATRFGARAAARTVQATPTLLLDGRYRWTGALPVADILLLASGGDLARMGAAGLESLLGSGQAARVAELLIAAGRIPPAFIGLLVDERLSARLGAMVVVETIAAEAPEVAAEIVAPLWAAYDASPDTVKGDILYLLGLVADSAQVPRIAAVAAGSGAADVREAAAEALEAITARTPPD